MFVVYGIVVVEKMLDDFDILVLMKVKLLLDDLISLLEWCGLLVYSCFIEKVGLLLECVVIDVV